MKDVNAKNCIKLILYRIYSSNKNHFVFTDAEESPIQQFYRNKSVFLTGGTGFFGKGETPKWKQTEK